MKKFISVTLVITMLAVTMLSSVTGFAAQSITFGESEAKEVCEFFAENMRLTGDPDDIDAAAERREIISVVYPYFETTTGINSIISMVEAESSDIEIINNILNAPGFTAEKKATIIFALKLIKCTTDSARQAAIEKFLSEDNEVVLSTEEAEALDTFYDILIKAEAQAILESDLHNVTAARLLNTVTPFAGCFMLTDNEVGGSKLALKDDSISSDFETAVDEAGFADYEINGAAIESAEDLVVALCDAVNDDADITTEEIADLKTILGAIGLYTEKESERRPVGGGSSAPTTDKETTTETVENEDGSKTEITTETVTNKDGSVTETVTETVTNADGTKETTEIKTVTNKDGSQTSTGKTNGGTTATVKKDAAGNTVEASATIGKEDAKSGKVVTLPADVNAGNDSAETEPIDITVPETEGGVNVEIPVNNVTTGTVAIVVADDGAEQIVTNAIVTEEGVLLNLVGDAKVKIVENSKRFIDIDGHWAKSSIDFVSARGIFNGTSEDTFSPNDGMSRAMFAQVIHNIELNPDHTFDGTFHDLEHGEWYIDAIHWAAERGVVTGYPDGTFGPNILVSREQIAAMLWRYAGSPETDFAIDFADAEKVGPYAKTAVAWAVENGIINGMGDNTLQPQETATRAQVAAMLHRFCNIMYK